MIMSNNGTGSIKTNLKPDTAFKNLVNLKSNTEEIKPGFKFSMKHSIKTFRCIILNFKLT